MSVQTEIDRISTAVQNAHLKVIEKGGTSEAPYLVANLESAIDTIPVGEDVTAETTEYTELLTDLEAAVDALPEAGGGESVETCTVVINTTISRTLNLFLMCATCYKDGVITPVYVSSYTSLPHTIENVICGTTVYAGISGSASIPTWRGENCDIVGQNGVQAIAVITAAAGDTATMTFYDND